MFLKLAQQVFDCGKCLFCRKKKAYELAARCVLHSSIYRRNCFLTLTYDENLPGYHNKFNYTDVQKFKKRLRSFCKRKYNKRIEVFNVHEYGKNGKKHWHLIVFNHDFEDKELFTKKNQIPLYTSRQLQELWPYGFSTVGDVSEASAMYQAQYMEKDFKNNNVGSSKGSHSKHSGIGKPYFLKYYRDILLNGFVPFNGKKMPIPRYFLRLAHKHYCHFNEKSAFFKTIKRDALYRPFKEGEENIEIADLYIFHMQRREKLLEQMEDEWTEVISQFLTEGTDPGFMKSAQNALHDLKNKQQQERF